MRLKSKRFVLSSPNFKGLALFATCLSGLAQAQPVETSRTTRDASIYFSARSPTAADPDLVRKLLAGNVSELKPIDQGMVLTAQIPLGDTTSREVIVAFELPTKVLIHEEAESSKVDLNVYASEVGPDLRFAFARDADTVRVYPPREVEMCALSLVHDRALSVLGTCALAKISVVPGGRVSVLVGGRRVEASRAVRGDATPPR